MYNKTLIKQLLEAADGEKMGYVDTLLPHVKLYVLDQYQSACPLMYDSGLFFVLQGSKRGKAAGQEFSTSPQTYLLLSNTMPVECETLAQPDEPVVGIYVAFNRDEISRQVHIMESHKIRGEQESDAAEQLNVINSISTPDRLAALVSQLADVMLDPCQLEILGPSFVNQLYYQVLMGPGYHTLKQWVSADSKFSAVTRSIEYMQSNLTKRISVDDLASIAGMSVSAYHHYFKQVTGVSPLQHLKQLRLVRAKDLLVQQKLSASQTAFDVGYESPNQFSREFKRYFGVPPSKAATLPYTNI